MKTKISERGFTLVELMVVIAIIGMLSSVVFANTSKARNSAYNAYTTETMEQYVFALESLRMDNDGVFPVVPGIACVGKIPPGATYCTYSTIFPKPELDIPLMKYLPSLPSPFINSTEVGMSFGVPIVTGSTYRCYVYPDCTKIVVTWILIGVNQKCGSGATGYPLANFTSCQLDM